MIKYGIGFAAVKGVQLKKLGGVVELNPKSKIIVMTTGGTIEKTYDEVEGTLYNRETVIRQRIEQTLRLPYVELEVKSVMAKDSLDMDDHDRHTILKAIVDLERHACPIVVLHGTDTMELSANLVQQNHTPSVAVVFTGAMKPLGFEDSDAIQNVTEALMACRLLSPGVYISFHSRLFSVPGTRKNKFLRTFEAY